MVFLKHARAEVDQLKKEVKRLRALEVHNTKELESYRAAVDAHTELGDRLENRVKLAEETSDRLAQQIKREQEVFKASVASSTAQSRRLHQLLSRMDATDDSATVRYRRRIEDLEERVKRLVRANKTLRSRVKLEEMDPDVLVLVVEGLSTGELDWGLLDISERTRVLLKGLLRTADPAQTDDSLANDLARAAFMETDPLEESTPEARAADARKTT
ncbi:hypothetical protein PR002_g32294, partial [Phytophthora rubi]